MDYLEYISKPRQFVGQPRCECGHYQIEHGTGEICAGGCDFCDCGKTCYELERDHKNKVAVQQ